MVTDEQLAGWGAYVEENVDYYDADFAREREQLYQQDVRFGVADPNEGKPEAPILTGRPYAGMIFQTDGSQEPVTPGTGP